MLRLVAVAFAIALVGASAAWALQQPGRTIVRDGPIISLGLTGRTVGFAVGRTASDCDHVELWDTASRGFWRLGRKRACNDVPVFKGIGQIGVSGRRAVWVEYAGGNITEWQLFTASVTSPQRRELKFIARDTGDPAPLVVGNGTPAGVPYAARDEVTWLAPEGSARFRWTAPAEVRALAAGDGPSGAAVAVLTEDGAVTLLDSGGAPLWSYADAAGTVSWIALAPRGLLVQLPGARVEIRNGTSTSTVQLPSNAVAVDFAAGRLLYRVGQSFRLRTVGTGEDVALLEGSPRGWLPVQLDSAGLAWARGASLHWACAACIRP